MAEQAEHKGRSTAKTHQELQQQQQQHQQHQHQQHQQHRTIQSPPPPPLPNSPPGYHHQNQQSYFQHQSARPPYSHQHPFYQPQEYQNQSRGPFDMAAMAQGLPRADLRHPQAYSPTGTNPMHGQPAASHSQYPGQQVSPMQMPFYATQQGGMAPQQFHGNPMPGRPNYYYPNQQQPGPAAFYYPQPSQYPGPGSQTSQGYGQPAAPAGYTHAAYPQRRRSQSTVKPGGSQSSAASGQPNLQRKQPNQSQTRPATAVRGPPRKPKQSGHAIWIGNLPPQTELMDLVHHVCQQTDGLQSLFLISKSNCAFANFPDEERCQVAQQKVNDTWFKSVRLVSRLRKSSMDIAQGITPSTRRLSVTAAAAAAASTEYADKALLSPGANAADASLLPDPPKKSVSPSSLVVDGTGKPTPLRASDDGMTTTPIRNADAGGNASAKGDRYFVLKSLTVDDLALSVQTGIWATQAHNEQVLNEAFNSCDNVYLVFSANKSGEYYGYARMTSEINNDPAAAVEFAPTAHSFNEIDLPKAIPTDATGKTPRGRIIDDSARGTIFWEAQSDDGFSTNPMEADEADVDDEAAEMDDVDKKEEEPTEPADPAEPTDADPTDAEDSASILEDGAGEPKAWGKPFQLEWLSTARLPFYRTRGLRNPLNANREVKIARDGTEVDADVGKKLVALFHQAPVGSPEPGGGRSGSFSFAGNY